GSAMMWPSAVLECRSAGAAVPPGEPDAAVRLSLLHAGLRDQARALDADRRAGGAGPDGVPALRPGHDLRLDRLADQDAGPEGRRLGALPEEGLAKPRVAAGQRPAGRLDAGPRRTRR